MTQRPVRDPRARQQAIVAERDTLVEETARSLDPLRRRLFRVLFGWAQRFGPDREQALFYMGAGWPTLRRMALELGRRLVEGGSFRAPPETFFFQTPQNGGDRKGAATENGRGWWGGRRLVLGG